MKRLLCSILLILFVCPFAAAQKKIITAVTKQAETLGLKASQRDLQELEKRFALLIKEPSRTSMERVSMLLSNRVGPSLERDELEALFRAGQYQQAQAKVHLWRTGEELSQQAAPKTRDEFREKFVNRFLQFDLYKGAELKQAVLWLQAGHKARLINIQEYRNAMWSLSRLDYRNVQLILTQSNKAVLHSSIHKLQYEKSQLQLAKMYEWEDLHSRRLNIPPVEDVSRREAIRQVLGPLVRGKKQPLSTQQAYYEQLPPWKQQQLDTQIDQMEAIITQRVTAVSAQHKRQKDKQRFSMVFARFISGNSRSSWTVIKVLYSPYVSAETRQEAEKAFAQGVSYGQAIKAGDVLFAQYAQNLDNHIMPSPNMQARVLDPMNELDEYLNKNRQWPQEGSDLFARLQYLETAPGLDGAKLMIKRLKQHLQEMPESKAYASLQQYIAQYGKMPPATSPLYHAVLRYKRIPGPYRERFQTLFEKYRNTK